METPTKTEIDQHYSALLDSVMVINKAEASGLTDEETLDTIDRNKRHLKLMLSRDYWGKRDLTAIKAAAE